MAKIPVKKIEIPKAEPPKVEAPKVEAKAELPKVEAPKTETSSLVTALLSKRPDLSSFAEELSAAAAKGASAQALMALGCKLDSEKNSEA